MVQAAPPPRGARAGSGVAGIERMVLVSRRVLHAPVVEAVRGPPEHGPEVFLHHQPLIGGDGFFVRSSSTREGFVG